VRAVRVDEGRSAEVRVWWRWKRSGTHVCAARR
jgi:hypothetical protein